VNFSQGVRVGDQICVLKRSVVRFKYDCMGRDLVPLVRRSCSQ